MISDAARILLVSNNLLCYHFIKMAQPTEDTTPPQPALTTPATTTVSADQGNPPKSDPDQQLEFLYKALDDNQSLIRFLDAKAAFAVALLSAMVGKVLSNLGDYFPRSAQPLWRQILVLAFAFAAIWAVVLVALIVFPTINPAANTRLLSNTRPLFFLSQLSPRRWQRILSRSPNYSQLAQDHAEYLNQITGSNSLVLLQVISGEVLKVSYIRHIKADRLKALGIVLACCGLLFVLLMAADATLPKPIKPTLIQVPGPLTVNPPPTTKPPPVKP